MIEEILASHLVLIIAALVISALPLYFALKLVGGQGGIFRILVLSLLLSFASIGAARFIGIFAGLFMLFATLFVYSLAFKISIFRAFIAWVLQYVFVFLAVFIALIITGIAL
jgi:hypothetical protein